MNLINASAHFYQHLPSRGMDAARTTQPLTMAPSRPNILPPFLREQRLPLQAPRKPATPAQRRLVVASLQQGGRHERRLGLPGATPKHPPLRRTVRHDLNLDRQASILVLHGHGDQDSDTSVRQLLREMDGATR